MSFSGRLDQIMLTVSVVVPVLNERTYLGKCVEALLAQQTGADLKVELIFVDNGSTDGSLELLQACPDVTLLHEPQKDPYLARNRGIRAARGHLIVLTDADCIPTDDAWLENLCLSAEREQADIVLGDLCYPEDVSLLLRCHEDYYNAKTAWLLASGTRHYLYGHAGNMLIRASVFERVGLFEAMPIVGDTEIIHRLLMAFPESRVVHQPDARVIHREVTRYRACLGKLFESGRYSADYQAVSDYRTLDLRMKLDVMRTCMRRQQYGPIRSMALLASLSTGLLAFQWGMLSARRARR